MAYIEEKFELNSGVSGVTESDGLGATWHADIWDFKVPINNWILLKPKDVFSCYLVGDDGVEMPAKTQVRIVKRDVANEEAKPILPNLLYQQIKNFRDRDLVMHINVRGVVEVGPEEHIVVQVNGADVATTGDLDASASHFKLVTTRRRKRLD